VSERDEIHRKAVQFFDDLWKRGDHWELESSNYERARLDRLLQTVADRRYSRALEIGCGSGTFTKRLATVADRTVGLDISPEAIERARQDGGVPDTVELRVANAMELDLRKEGSFDLVVMSETVCYLGWLYPFFDVAWFAHELFKATAAGGRLLLANTYGDDVGDALLLPWVIRSYHDMFRNVGYRVEREETFRGEKHGVAFEVLISLLRKD
jgi:predicted TPR repeat methyltransferase